MSLCVCVCISTWLYMENFSTMKKREGDGNRPGIKRGAGGDVECFSLSISSSTTSLPLPLSTRLLPLPLSISSSTPSLSYWMVAVGTADTRFNDTVPEDVLR